LAMNRRAGACAGRWVGERLEVCCLWRGEGWRGWAGVNELRGRCVAVVVSGARRVAGSSTVPRGLGRCTHIRGGDVVDFAARDETQGGALLIHLGECRSPGGGGGGEGGAQG
jgi:hypothetical protein